MTWIEAASNVAAGQCKALAKRGIAEQADYAYVIHDVIQSYCPRLLEIERHFLIGMEQDFDHDHGTLSRDQYKCLRDIILRLIGGCA